MDLASRLFADRSTGRPLDYRAWCNNYELPELFGLEPVSITDRADSKIDKDLYASVDPENRTPLPIEMDDLIRLHFLAINRRATTILEFGVGKSTRVFTSALRSNKKLHEDFVRENFRRSNPFELHSVDNYAEWIEQCRGNLPEGLLPFANFHCAPVEMTTFNGRACTMYETLPNVCPDLIYLDGPDQNSVIGDVRGISTRSKDRLPMAADILLFEHFLLPGTLIIVDGRTANARFLRCNLQRDWEYHHFVEEDIHAFELVESPLGKINARQIAFSR